MAPDERGIYNWTEVTVNKTLERDCYFNEPQDPGKARRFCAAHHTWANPFSDNMLTYDGSMCITKDTHQLILLSRVSYRKLRSIIIAGNFTKHM